MGKGIDLAREDSPEHAAVLDDFKDQLLIVMLRRLGGNVEIPIRECDETGGQLFMMKVDEEKGMFHFELRSKQ